MSKKLTRWSLPLMLVISLTTACVRTVEVPTMVPRPPCPLNASPDVPVLSTGSDGTNVLLPPDQAVALGLWIRENRRWRETARACLGIEVPND